VSTISTIDDGILSRGRYSTNRGSGMLDTQRLISNVGDGVDCDPLFREVTERHMRSRYAIFLDDEQKPGYSRVSLALGYRVPDMGQQRRPVTWVHPPNPGISLTSAACRKRRPMQFRHAIATQGIVGTPIRGRTPLHYSGAHSRLW
jgi:hypothetical protein